VTLLSPAASSRHRCSSAMPSGTFGRPPNTKTLNPCAHPSLSIYPSACHPCSEFWVQISGLRHYRTRAPLFRVEGIGLCRYRTRALPHNRTIRADGAGDGTGDLRACRVSEYTCAFFRAVSHPGRMHQPVCTLASQTQPVCMLASQTQPVCMLASQTQPVCMLASQTQPVCMLASQTQPVCMRACFMVMMSRCVIMRACM
jgi:hypothetical protein